MTEKCQFFRGLYQIDEPQARSHIWGQCKNLQGRAQGEYLCNEGLQFQMSRITDTIKLQYLPTPQDASAPP